MFRRQTYRQLAACYKYCRFGLHSHGFDHCCIVHNFGTADTTAILQVLLTLLQHNILRHCFFYFVSFVFVLILLIDSPVRSEAGSQPGINNQGAAPAGSCRIVW